MDDTAIESLGVRPSSGDMQRLIRLSEVMARVGLKRSSIYQRMAEGRFPRSRSQGSRCTVWVESEIAEYIAGIANAAH